MRVAEVLSDLTSLRVCDPSAALALVCVRPSASPTTAATSSTDSGSAPPTTSVTVGQQGEAKDKGEIEEEEDPALRRARDVVTLHYEIKNAQSSGVLADELRRMREDVGRAVGEL
ncbi:hypothetical protein K490DRAFT_64844 [Saccharata proteae CBS 121410]|uniref:Uncharacterized protein n=1 Tax=Saccharata proteae CBS 121410 TaxID=1314787 RepID=A0A9P4LXH1_9PEZI|nr:hypothetical protein K490DRAFT_64844 [Saccharata proteae CBS 121410]